ncbi:hypothetical protein [Nocardioides pinisoli]|uniref:Uncharacterized protein n=1 Tax=Nocardioides pinisoli TaxID=2950279 RepID=A0ABT1KYF7_9ACTN|nr:hypothetical protein [Nocardioides pinisoli]MCP3422782.1 hypothetical protein [Nocardioides pinisoli]
MLEPTSLRVRRPRLVVPVRVDPAGLEGPTPGSARGPGWRRTSQGFYVPSDVERSPEQRIVEAAVVLRDDEAVTGWASLRWMGAAWFDGTTGPTALRDVPLLARRDRAAPRGAVVSQEFLHPDEITSVDGVPVTHAVRSVLREMRLARTLGDAVVALDMACYADLVSLAEVATRIRELGPVTGVQQARDALALGDENSWSPQETMMRGVWTRMTDLERPLANRPVFSLDGHHVGTPDLVAPVLGLVAQYNGSDHLSLAGAAADTKKDAAYRDLGLETVTMLATDRSDLDDFVARLNAAARRAAAGNGRRLWTLQEPAWWTPTHTVALRRGLQDHDRTRLLRYRRTA